MRGGGHRRVFASPLSPACMGGARRPQFFPQPRSRELGRPEPPVCTSAPSVWPKLKVYKEEKSSFSSLILWFPNFRGHRSHRKGLLELTPEFRFCGEWVRPETVSNALSHATMLLVRIPPGGPVHFSSQFTSLLPLEYLLTRSFVSFVAL